MTLNRPIPSRLSVTDTEVLSPERRVVILPVLKVVMLPVDRVVMLPVWLLLRVVILPAKVVDDITAIRMLAHNRDGADLMTFLLVNRTFTGFGRVIRCWLDCRV